MSQVIKLSDNSPGTVDIVQLTGNSGVATADSAGNVNVLGSGNISASGASNTLTLTLVGTTNHAVQIGNALGSLTSLSVGSTGVILQGNTGADPTWSTATYPSTTTVNQILYSSSANVVGGISAVIDGVLISNHASGVPSWLPNGTAGQVLTAQSGAPPAWADGYTPSGSVITEWIDDAVGITVSAGKGYIATTALTWTLPSSPSQGDTIGFIVNTAGTVGIDATGSQLIRIGNIISTIPVGAAVASGQGATLTLVYQAASDTWHSVASTLTWVLT